MVYVVLLLASSPPSENITYLAYCQYLEIKELLCEFLLNHLLVESFIYTCNIFKSGWHGLL